MNDPLKWSVWDADGTEKTFRMLPVMSIDSTPAILTAVRENVGIAVLPYFLAEAEIAVGNLVEVLPAWQLPMANIYAVYPASRFRPSRVSVFIAMLIEAETHRGNH